MIPSEMRRNFEELGFVIIRDFWFPDEIAVFEKKIASVYRMQAVKMDEHSHLRSADVASVCAALETRDKEALYQVQKFLPDVPPLKRLMIGLSTLSDKLIDAPPETTLVSGPGLFVNAPKSQRLLYKWHSEEDYYPKRRTFMNCWWPLFHDKTKASGTLSFKVGSHKHKFPFVEYTGYDKDTEGKANHFAQLEVPENFLTGFSEFHCETKRGDLVVFHSNLVHRSNQNTSNEYSFAGIARVWNPHRDLTLSGDMAVKPYCRSDVGRAGLVVEP